MSLGVLLIHLRNPSFVISREWNVNQEPLRIYYLRVLNTVLVEDSRNLATLSGASMNPSDTLGKPSRYQEICSIHYSMLGGHAGTNSCLPRRWK